MRDLTMGGSGRGAQCVGALVLVLTFDGAGCDSGSTAGGGPVDAFADGHAFDDLGADSGDLAGSNGDGSVPVGADIQWLDPLGYPKPQPYPVALPDESAVSNKYWVDLSGGSGSACTMVAPCSWAAVQGKAGTHGDGGGAYIYIKNAGAIDSPTLYGTAGNEVVIRPWDDHTAATITGRNNWTTKIQYVVFDGGPRLQITFFNAGGGQFDPSIYFNASGAGLESHITFYRTHWNVGGSGEYISQWGQVDNLSIINSEFESVAASDTSNQHHIYLSGASNYGPSAHIYLRNNIFRDTPGEQIELRMFQAIDDLVIDGNAFHNVGKGTCSSSWKCRGAITLVDLQTPAGLITNVQISNNLMWDLGEGAVRCWASGANIFNNTVWHWGQGNPQNGNYGTWAFYGYAADGRCTVKNNILYGGGTSQNGNPLVPFDGSPNIGAGASSNACPTGQACGASSVLYEPTGTNQTLASIDPASASFMKLAGTASSAYGKGETLPPVLMDYTLAARVAPYDIGAFRYK